MYITVFVNPRSRFEKVEQISDREYRLSFNVPPEKGRANQKVIEMLSEYLKVPKSSVEIKMGKTTREKVIYLTHPLTKFKKQNLNNFSDSRNNLGN